MLPAGGALGTHADPLIVSTPRRARLPILFTAVALGAAGTVDKQMPRLQLHAVPLHAQSPSLAMNKIPSLTNTTGRTVDNRSET